MASASSVPSAQWKPEAQAKATRYCSLACASGFNGVERLPWLLLVPALLLVAIGCLGIARCEELAGTDGRYLRRQVVWSVLAMVALAAATIPSPRAVCRWSYLALVGAVVLLAMVHWFPAINGARRWIRIGPIGFQPSELAKVAYVLALARYLMYGENHRRFWGLMLPLGLTLVPVLLILREPNLGTALLFLPVLLVMLFAAGARRRDLAWLALAGVFTLPLLWSQMSREQKSRVTALLEQAGPGESTTSDTYQSRQAKQMLMLGGVWGSLLAGQAVDDPGAYHLPEARGDFIFAVLGERLGLLGIAVVLGLYGAVVWRGLAIALAAREPFSRLAAVGLTSLVAVQTLIHAGMAVGLLPVTGLPLPLVSYGGSGLLGYGLVLGLLANIAMRPGYDVAGEPFRYIAGRRRTGLPAAYCAEARDACRAR
jgi:cell division protein FtsW (lipid II flippase)